MQITICRGEKSLVRVIKNGRVFYFEAGRHTTERRIKEIAASGFIKMQRLKELEAMRVAKSKTTQETAAKADDCDDRRKIAGNCGGGKERSDQK